MAKNKRDADLIQTLRESGLRKKVAKTVTESASQTKQGKPPTAVARTIDSLRTAASELEDRVHGSRRSAAGQKAAQTRKRNAAKRSASAKKAAKTRAKAGS
jgi:hypothetical protein